MKKEIIDRFLKGELSEEGRVYVFQWLVNNKKEHEVNAFLKTHWEAVNKKDQPLDADLNGVYKRISDSLEEENSISNLSIGTDGIAKNKTVVFPLLLKYAAIAFILIASSLFYITYENKEAVLVATTEVVKENPMGVKSLIQLPDGTKVWLNAASSITYQSSFSSDARNIELKGEAYFEVVKDPKRPFNVVTKNIITTALGTSFNINTYKKEHICVSLNTGKVKVTRSEDMEEVILLPGDQANASVGELSIVKFNREQVLAWHEGIIYFDDTNLDQVVAELEKWYDVAFVVQNISAKQKAELKITGKFKNQTLASVLKLLSHSMDFKYSIDNKIVTLNFQKDE
ncbi:MAG: FecR domain-containing protein [Reichenbachiella sp.]